MQIVNGLYITRTYSGAKCYADYRSYIYDINSTLNSNDYSAIPNTGYRYASFAWKCATNAGNYTKITFTINGLTQTITTPDGTPQDASNNLYMFYRIEDTSNPTTSSSNFSAAYKNTAWLNVNGLGINTDLTGGNYYIYSNIYNGKNTSIANTYSGGILTMNVLIPSTSIGSSDTVNIYLRIGLPMAVNLGFSYVSATLS